MNENNGYVKLYRKTLNNPIVCKDSDHLAIWIYLLLSATHTELSVLFNGEKMVLKPGQLITGTLSIANKLKINKMKVQRTLSEFENDKQIVQQTTNKNRLISILNWEEYQFIDKQDDKQLINNCETTDKQLITNNNVKNEINNKKEINNNKLLFIQKKFEKPTLLEIKKYCDERNNGIDPESFFDYYESNGWCVGKNKMKDWKACVRTWEKNTKGKTDKFKSYQDKKIDEWEKTKAEFLKEENKL